MESTSLNVVASSGEMKAGRNFNAEGFITRLAVIGVVDGTVDANNVILTLDNLLQQGAISQLRSIAASGLQDSASREKFVELCKLFTLIYDNYKSSSSEASSSAQQVLFSKYKDNPELANHFCDWRTTRKVLIDVSKSTANRLDQQFFIVNIARMIGSFVEILNALNLGLSDQFCKFIDSYASPKLGMIIKTAIQFAPYLRFMGFVSSFIDILESQVRIKRVKNIVKDDREMFEPLKQWLEEAKELNDTAKQLLPYEINKKITKSIDDALKDLGEEQKIFSAAVLSNIMKDPMILKDEKFMSKAFRFCGSDAAKGWYKRLITDACPSEQDCYLLNLYEELRKGEGAGAEFKSTVENDKGEAVEQVENCKGVVEQVGNAAKSSVKPDFSRYAICMISGLSIYWSYGNIRAGTKHRYSDRLRKLSRKAQSYLNVMEQIGSSHIDNFRTE